MSYTGTDLGHSIIELIMELKQENADFRKVLKEERRQTTLKLNQKKETIKQLNQIIRELNSKIDVLQRGSAVSRADKKEGFSLYEVAKITARVG